MSEMCCMPNYEQMYHERCDEVAKLREENEHLRAEVKLVSEHNQILRAQLDIVHLIFGKNW